MLGQEDEIRRLRSGERDSPASGALARIHIRAADAPAVIDRTRSALLSVLRLTAEELDAEISEPTHLPSWLVASFARARTEDERAAWLEWWRDLDVDARRQAEEETPWEMADWLSWMAAEERSWRWWSAEVSSPTTAVASIDVLDWPAPTEALWWLMTAAGARDVEGEEG